jgi:ABC-2 type transport system permease protein
VVVVFTSVVLLFLSGLSWPQTAIPKFWIWVSYIFPSSLGIQGFVKVNCMGATIADVSGELIKMCIQVLVYFLTACAVYRLQVARSQRLFLRKERRELRQKALIERLEKEGDAREQEDS